MTNNILEGILSVANGKFAGCMNAKSEFDKIIKGKIESYLRDLNLVTSEDFELLKEMNVKIIEENSQLKKDIKKLQEMVNENR